MTDPFETPKQYAQNAVAEELDGLREENARLRAALTKINAIRNSIVGLQTISWSEHIYPLVATLNEAGIEGLGYPKSREYFGTMLERTNKAEARIEALEKARDALPRIVCLCGSSRFVAEMACIAWAFERDEGCITLGLHLLPESYPVHVSDHLAEAEGCAEHMDELHKRKIDLADEIFVVNVGGYIGDSTRSEIDYARAHGKPVRYLEALSSEESGG